MRKVHVNLRPSLFLFFIIIIFFRLTSDAFPDIGSVGRIFKKKKTKKIKQKKSRNRRPGTPASLLWSLETTRYEPKIKMAEKDDVKS